MRVFLTMFLFMVLRFSSEAQDAPVKWATRETYFEDLVGTDLKNFTGLTVNGKPFSGAELKGQIVLFNFWFEKCPPCVAEMPELNRLVAQYKSAGIRFIAITPDSPKTAKKFQKKMGYQYEVLCLSAAEIQKLNINNGYPTNVLVARNGKIIKAMGNLSFTDQFPDIRKESVDFEQKLKAQLIKNN